MLPDNDGVPNELEHSHAWKAFLELVSYRVERAEESIATCVAEQAKTREKVLAGQLQLKLEITKAIAEIRADMAEAIRKSEARSKNEITILKDAIATDRITYSVDIGKLKQTAGLIGAVTGTIMGPIAAIIASNILRMVSP